MALAVIAVFNAFTAFLAYRTHQVASITKQVVLDTKQEVGVVKDATNGLQEALVAATAKASQAAGELKGRADTEERLAKHLPL